MTGAVHVLINGVEAGSLPLAQYEEIRRQPKRDVRVYCSQLVVIVKVISNILAYAFFGLPVAMCAMLILCLMTPGVIADTVQVLSAYTPQQVENAVRLFVTFAATVSFVAIIIGAMMSRGVRKQLGCEDAFATESDRRLRVFLGISTTGPIHVYERSESQPSQPA